ncbi:MAG: class I SAM-dependent methyltransferase [Alphaproteobacteria bacterium]|nr:class I SAM-dependent methyltransferase [Alphaproteobacteria bacterium]
MARRGYFIPCRHAGAGPARSFYPEAERVLAAAAPQFEAVLDAVEDHAEALLQIGGDPPPQPRWTQGWFPRLDAAVAYTLVRRHRPRRIVEVGSGHSTRFLARAAGDGGLDVAITAIDPQPRADLARLPVRAVPADVRAVDPAIFAALQAGDMLVIDSSHVAMPGSDVDLLFNTVLPALPAGVLVHVHDVFLPEDYPADWRWRGYNEQLLAAALLTGGLWRPLFASRYVAMRMTGRLESGVCARLPLWPGVPETSLWLVRDAHGGLTKA